MPPPSPQRVTIVYAGQSWSWATWMEHRLAHAGATPVAVRWDPLHTEPDAGRLTRLLDKPGKLLLLIDDWFVRFDDARRQRWADVLAEVMPGEGHRVAAVSITAATLPPAAEHLGPVLPLRGFEAERASSVLLEALDIAPRSGGPVSLDRNRGPRFPEDRPDIDNAPRHNRDFTGRERLLESIHQAFTDGGEGTRIALCGPGGIGKTQTATEYAHRYKGEYDVVWWVRAAVRSRAREDFARLADRLGVEPDIGDALRGRIEAAKRALRDRARWLVVLDGAEEPEDIERLLPEGPGHVLVTTSRREWQGWVRPVIDVPPFQREESVDFACRRTGRLTHDSAARLAAAVQDHPLLMDQTAAWLELNEAADIDTYIDRLREGDPHVVPVVSSDEYRQAFQAAWAQTVNTLREKHPNAYELLSLFVFFSPDLIPLNLVQSARAVDLPDHLVSQVTEPSSWNAALRVLSEAASMRVEYEQGPMDIQTVGTLRMHRLFHRFVRGHLSADEARQAAGTARRVLVAADPRSPGQAIHWPRYAEIIPHLEPTNALNSGDADVRALVLNCVEYLRVRGEYKAGRQLSASAVAAWTTLGTGTDPAVLRAEHQLANMERRLGDYRRAEHIGRDVLARITADPERSPIQVLRAKNGLGGTLMALGRFEEARRLYEEAERQAAADLGDLEVPRTLDIRGNLAIVLRLLGRYDDSLRLHRTVLEAYIALGGGRDPATLLAGLNTAWTLRLLGRYGEALDVQEHNHRLHADALGRNHGQTLIAQHNLALCLRRQGSHQRARALMRVARDRMLRRHGPRHPETLMMSTDYAMLLRDIGELDEARELAESAHAEYTSLLGDDHPYVAGTRDDCALIQGDQGDVTGARPRAESARAAMERVLGTAHLWSVGCAMNTATALARTGELERAVALGEDALARARAAVGPTHVLTLNVAAGLAQDLAACGREEDAEAVRREAVGPLTERFFEEHRQVRPLFEGRRPYWDFEPQPI
ncbi:FxSxx-COOH system tetratricopeptide repeat protein [Streptomyces sp. NPDC002328]|uniref:FxSxx-COOH system tetratricopeptide repeat protein n=1 Tax=Streptomyces sp. NPDC002328 TaxID=3364642 RepID=UPI00368F112A